MVTVVGRMSRLYARHRFKHSTCRTSQKGPECAAVINSPPDLHGLTEEGVLSSSRPMSTRGGLLHTLTVVQRPRPHPHRVCHAGEERRDHREKAPHHFPSCVSSPPSTVFLAPLAGDRKQKGANRKFGDITVSASFLLTSTLPSSSHYYPY